MPSMVELLTTALPRSAEDLADCEEALEDLGEHMDVPILRFPKLDDRAELFADLSHMRDAGSQRLTTLLVDWFDSDEELVGAGGCRSRP